MTAISKTTFAPMLCIPGGVTDVGFYTKAFGAIELRRWSNDDGSTHVVEFSIDGSLFHLHEENLAKGAFNPTIHHGVTTFIGLMVPDVDSVIASAVAAGAKLTSPAQDYDYGYRQGDITDPFGHKWTIQTII